MIIFRFETRRNAIPMSQLSDVTIRELASYFFTLATLERTVGWLFREIPAPHSTFQAIIS